ncbi:hypothetical protein [Flexivirga lutea]
MGRPNRRSRADFERIALAFVYAAVLVPVAATVLIVHARGWWPTNDDAFTAMAMRDTWTGHPRVMGPWASTPGFSGSYPHHPGPALYYAASVGAVPFRFSAWGILVGVALVNGLAAVATVRVGSRVAGVPGAVAGAFAVLVTACSIGAGLFFRPFNPFPPLLLILLMLFVTVEFVGGQRCHWPLFVLAGTIAVQSHLSYAYLVTGLTAIVLVVGAHAWHRERDAWWPRRGWLPVGAERRRLTRPMQCCAVLAALLWLPVTLELIIYDPNNVTSLLQQLRSSAPAAVPAPTVDRFEFIARGLLPGVAVPSAKALTLLGATALALIASVARAVRLPPVLGRAARVALAGLALFVIQILMVPHTAYFAEAWMVAAGAPVAAFAMVVVIASLVELLRWLPVRLGSARGALAAVTGCALAVTGGLVVSDATTTSAGEIAVGQDVRAAESGIVAMMSRWPTVDGARRAVAVHGTGLGPVFEVAPSLGLALRNDGFEVFLPPAIQAHDDTAFRRTDRAPTTALPVAVVWLNEQPSAAPVPPTAEAVGVVRQGENHFGIYVLPPRD